MKQLKVDAIKHGTVIDHIKPGKALQVMKILNIPSNKEVMIGINLNSNKKNSKHKDIIKIENVFFDTYQINGIALISPEITLSIIKNFEIVDKQKIKPPKSVDKIVKCLNRNCITNVENLTTNFKIYTKKDVTRAQCSYCEKTVKIDDIRFNINN